DSGEQPREVFCNFEGKFSDLKSVDEYVYSMSLESLDTLNTPGEEYFRNGTKYISSTPYGLENTQEVYVYFPGCPTSSIPKEIADWVSMSYGIDVTAGLPDGYYILCDKNQICPFIGYKDKTAEKAESETSDPDTFSKAEIQEMLSEYLNGQIDTEEGAYEVCDESSENDTENSYEFVLRFSMSEKAVQAVIDAGGFPTANKLIDTITVDLTTGQVRYEGSGDTFQLWGRK
ncbi:MAG TPA: hypothetical protein IAB31_07980, partial [Candidatus Choladousia intestinavium]|nr:hypothetical protein [Candidatus Choladousia intestinavium]